MVMYEYCTLSSTLLSAEVVITCEYCQFRLSWSSEQLICLKKIIKETVWILRSTVLVSPLLIPYSVSDLQSHLVRLQSCENVMG